MAGEWETVDLGQTTEKIGSGATPRGGSETYLADGPFALIRSQNVLDLAFSRAGLAYINADQAEALSNVEVKPKDVLINITGDSVARACMVDASILPARVNQHVSIVRANAAAFDQRYLLYSLVEPKMKQRLLSLASAGATRNALTKGDLERLRITRPPLSEQQQIADLLGSLDDKIELNWRMAETLGAMARALFKSWFVDFDPVHAKVEGRPTGFSDDIESLFPDSFGRDGLPVGWKLTAIANLFEVRGGNTPRTENAEFWDGDHEWATPKDLSGLATPVLLKTGRRLTDLGLKRTSSGLLPPGSLLLSTRAPIGYMAFITLPTAINQGFAGFIRTNVSPAYAWTWCQANMDLVTANAAGSTFPEISKAVLRQLPMLAPTQAVLDAFGAIADPLVERIVAATEEMQALADLRNALLPRLISGELRLADAEKKVSAA